MKHTPHTVDILREHCTSLSRRPFLARGSSAIRCSTCLMAENACFCLERKATTSPINFILLYHRDEIFKPTNSGRLIADLFPEQTQAYLWSRTEPDIKLLDHISNLQGKVTILYPETERRTLNKTIIESEKASFFERRAEHTFIVLDGTWKQASKMLHQSRWLDSIPTLAINEASQRTFLVRHSGHDMQFATAEVVSMLLSQLELTEQSDQLLHYYQTFNRQCLKSRKRGNDL
ncbi:tRNA-uridine aminocarboxypropyltransferase [Marinomonas balearica]|uniref:tRNA-uridine aminocarboxypropyltransferase n=1 Tax=Marinomonas balearica TaxID=491947 RepID=A0A4R6MHW4_9GAMM|nr:tRNA-uridine aminocarboxypropyltransferase [Marinomonas balearica]TDO99779.1 hypothetical protein DFP79_0782 [Marinomonas balearica]